MSSTLEFCLALDENSNVVWCSQINVVCTVASVLDHAADIIPSHYIFTFIWIPVKSVETNLKDAAITTTATTTTNTATTLLIQH